MEESLHSSPEKILWVIRKKLLISYLHSLCGIEIAPLPPPIHSSMLRNNFHELPLLLWISIPPTAYNAEICIVDLE